MSCGSHFGEGARTWRGECIGRQVLKDMYITQMSGKRISSPRTVMDSD